MQLLTADRETRRWATTAAGLRASHGSKMRFLSRATMSFEVRATLRWREADSNFGSREDESIQEFQRLGPDPSLLRAPACALSLPGEI
jgi:hypothetical protein